MKYSMISTFLIIIGVVCLLVGIGLKVNPVTTINAQKEIEVNIEGAPASVKNKPYDKVETETEKKGLLFEEYVVQKFNKKYFTIKEWRSDKFVNGHFAESSKQPDFELLFKLKDFQQLFAIECKWKNSLYKNQLEWTSEEKLAEYKAYQLQKQIPVFIVVGLGGTPDDPAEIFIINLDNSTRNTLSYSAMANYRRADIQKGFYFDTHTKQLK